MTEKNSFQANGRPPGPAPGIVIAAPSSGSGKTLLTLGLLRALRNRGKKVASAKAGPDYIDPAFHAAASGRVCVNLDVWAMRAETLSCNVAETSAGADVLICEGVMGLFDGAVGDRGSTADLATRLGVPVVLVVDASAQAASAAALVRGFATHREDTLIAGVIFNRIGGDRHAELLIEALHNSLPHIPCIGTVPRAPDLSMPSRHLGLVQAGEREDLEVFLDRAASHVGDHVDLDRLMGLARPVAVAGKAEPGSPIPPLGQRIAVARDEAFAFAYPHVLGGWRDAGAELTFFSPLAGDAPDEAADAVYLPGGYPELHAGRLADQATFLDGLRARTASGARVFGECGGYMVLGRELIDGDGASHAMAGLLPLVSSFSDRKLHLGYRKVTADTVSGFAGALQGHEFHYASVVDEGPGTPLFQAADARGNDLGPKGRVDGTVMGSFIHLIDRA